MSISAEIESSERAYNLLLKGLEHLATSEYSVSEKMQWIENQKEIINARLKGITKQKEAISMACFTASSVKRFVKDTGKLNPPVDPDLVISDIDEFILKPLME